MPTSTATRKIAAPAADLWELICDPHHLPRWWPRVVRVEGVDGDAFTEVLRSDHGRLVRADYLIVERDPTAMRLVLSQQVAGTPFAAVLRAAETELRLRELPEPGSATPTRSDADAAAGAGTHGAPATEVTITLSQTLPSLFASGGRNAAAGRSGGGMGSRSFYGLFANLGSFMVRRAAHATVNEALDGLERIAGAG